MSSRALCPGSTHQPASVLGDRWIPVTSTGMTLHFRASTPPVIAVGAPVVPGYVIGSPFSERTAR
jgi:hypothetical protein